MWKVFILALLLSPIISLSKELNCPQSQVFKAVDFRHEFGPMRTQGGIGWCYAYAGADLLHHWLLKKGEVKSVNEDDLISAAAIALNKIRSKSEERISKLARIKNHFTDLLFATEPENIETMFSETHNEIFDVGGDSATWAVALAEKGICTEGRVRSSILNTLELIPRDLIESGGRANKLDLLTRITRHLNPDDAPAIKAQFSFLSVDEIRSILTTSKSADAIFNLLDKSCEYKKVSVPKAKEVEFKNIDEVINQNRPVVLSVDGDLFDFADKKVTYDVGHAVTVVGKRFNCKENEPEYIIRNSWGPRACEKYLADFRRSTPEAEKATEEIESRYEVCSDKCSSEIDDENDFDSQRLCKYLCAKTMDKELIAANNPPYACENGYYVVRKSHLEKVVYDASYLE